MMLYTPASITAMLLGPQVTSGFLLLVIVESLAAMTEEMIDGFNDVIALDDMIGK